MDFSRSGSVVRAAFPRGALLLAASLVAAGCVTSSRATLAQRLTEIGLPRATASCMADDLAERLPSDDLRALARFTTRLSRAPSTAAAIEQLARIDNPRAAIAIGRAAFSCARFGAAE